MHSPRREADLYLNRVCVGTVAAEGVSDSWSYGEFKPHEEFGAFAQLFGVWSLLVHEDNGADEMPPEALEELAKAESAIDRIHAELRWRDTGECIAISQLNLDGGLIEWKPE